MKKFLLIFVPLAVIIILGLFYYSNSKPATQSEEQTTPPVKNMVQNGVDFSDGKAVEVIDYDGSYLLVSKLRIGEPHPKHSEGPGCPEQHWHADEPITAVNSGQVLTDPLVGGCGFGILNERPIMNYFPHELLAD